ncbi:MAG: Spy/CpxP family protein refolding chaperone [Aestuariivirga sp.]
MNSQERVLAARLDGVRAMKTAFGPLYKALTKEQRKAADELLAPHMGLIPAGMMQGGKMPVR